MKKIVLLSYYCTPQLQQKRITAPAANNKLDYIISTLGKLGYEVQVVSAAGGAEQNAYPASTAVFGNHATLTVFRTIGRKNLLIRVWDKLLIMGQLIRWFLRNVTRDSAVLVYHSLGYYRVVHLLQKHIGFKLIYEVEEIYADVMQNQRIKHRELRLLRGADAYIFPTEQLNALINTNEKPYCVAHGTYAAEAKRQPLFSDSAIHCVYAGTLDPRKGGALAAVSLGTYLPADYHIHIIGSGSDKELRQLLALIEEVNIGHHALVTYDGLRLGEEYFSFLQSCDIGLSTQNPALAYNDTSFPSKILSYLSNGLHVVSIRIPVVETSAAHPLLTYYDEQKPEKMAEAILSIDLQKPYDSRALIQSLDKAFTKQIQEVLDAI